MRFIKVISIVLAFCLLFTACATAQTGVNRKLSNQSQQSSVLASAEDSSVDNQISSQPISISSQESTQTSTQPISSVAPQSQIPSDTGVTSEVSSVHSQVSSILSGLDDVSSKEEPVVSKDLPVVSIEDYSEETSSTASTLITSSQPTKDINAVPDYLKDHPVMEGTRDKYYWPFSKDSIWNMPIGSDAKLEPAGFKTEKNVAVDTEYFVQTKDSDPVIDVYSPSSWQTRMPGKKKTGELKVPNDFILADGTGHNNCATFIMPNGYTYYQLEPTCRTAEYPDRIIGYMCKPMSLYEQGIGGSHYGSGLSAIGGSIRKGELTSSGNINHAIKINVWANKYLHYSTQVPGFTWPADRCDRYANTEGNKNKYEGTNPLIVQGSLLVLPKTVTVESLGIKTEVGKKIFYALQNYGAYISDDSAWSCYALCAEEGVDEEVQAKYGFSLKQTEYEGNRGLFYQDMNKMMTNLYVVTNNTRDSIGGGGTPCQPLAPDFAE